MKRIIALAVVIVALSGCTPSEINAWIRWHRTNPEEAQAWLQQPAVAEELALDANRDGALSQAERLDTPAPPPEPVPTSFSSDSSNGRCVGAEGLLAELSPGWDVGRMSRIMYRESRCQPSASNSCCSGLLQVHRIWIPEAGECGIDSRDDLYDPRLNICAAAVIYRQQGMGAWG